MKDNVREEVENIGMSVCDKMRIPEWKEQMSGREEGDKGNCRKHNRLQALGDNRWPTRSGVLGLRDLPEPNAWSAEATVLNT